MCGTGSALPVNMLDPILKCFGYGQVTAASVLPELGWIKYAGSNFPDPIHFHSSKKGPDHIVQNWPGSSLDGLVRFWPNTSCLEAHWCIRIIRPSSHRTQPACNQFFLPLSDSVGFFHRQPGSYCAKPVEIQFGSG